MNPTTSPHQICTRTTTAALAAISALHVAWGRGSTFPFATRTQLNNAVIGRQVAPSPMACNTVAVALAGAAIVTSHASRNGGPIARAGASIVAVVLAARACVGFAGRTHRIVPGSDSATFRRLDRSIYSPLCAGLAYGAARAALSADSFPAPRS